MERSKLKLAVIFLLAVLDLCLLGIVVWQDHSARSYETAAMEQARSVDPTPVEKAPTAPYVQVWESAPITTSPGLIRPLSGRITCSTPMPSCPCSK